MNMVRIGSRASLLGSAAVLAFTACSPALAQDTAQPSEEAVTQGTSDDRPTEGSGQLIVVTAQKREQVLLDSPAIGDGDRRRHPGTPAGDQSSRIYVAHPGLQPRGRHPGDSRITLRGANTGGVSFDRRRVHVTKCRSGRAAGLANGSILSGDFDPFDLNRIEVLRGPQGTLYGASSFGGVLKFVTNAPQLGEISRRARAGIENVKSGDIGWNATGRLNVPIGDKAALRASGYYRKEAGWIDATRTPLIGSAGSAAERISTTQKATAAGRRCCSSRQIR